jgi:hypothetical protein
LVLGPGTYAVENQELFSEVLWVKNFPVVNTARVVHGVEGITEEMASISEQISLRQTFL